MHEHAAESGAMGWVVRQLARMRPAATRTPDRFERTAQWVAGMCRPVTLADLARAHQIGKYEAMRRLRTAAARRLIARRASELRNRPDEFEAPARAGR
jgi:hypothetical protein